MHPIFIKILKNKSPFGGPVIHRQKDLLNLGRPGSVSQVTNCKWLFKNFDEDWLSDGYIL